MGNSITLDGVRNSVTAGNTFDVSNVNSGNNDQVLTDVKKHEFC